MAFAACSDDGVDKITLTLQPNSKVEILLNGSGTATIAWGDGTKKKKHELTGFDKYWDEEKKDEYTVSHNYSGTSVRTITITGNNITHLGCFSLGLTDLDVSKNSALIGLVCGDNQLTNLDVKNNPVLTRLSCGDNLLTSLDVSNNPLLTMLLCDKNQLTNLNVSKCSELEYVSCSGNLLSAEALNVLFDMLPLRPEERKGFIYFENNPGTNTCNREIASVKGWFFNKTF